MLVPGRYKAEHRTEGFAHVHHLWLDSAYGFFFQKEGDRPEFCTWSLDGKSHMGRGRNIKLES